MKKEDVGFDRVTQSWYYCRGEGRPLITGFRTEVDAHRYAAKAEAERKKLGGKP